MFITYIIKKNKLFMNLKLGIAIACLN